VNGQQQQAGEKLSQNQTLEEDPFDYQATVNELTVQFLSEWEETRVTTLNWLIMLHNKAPKKVYGLDVCQADLVDAGQILNLDDGTFPALLKTLNDSSEEVYFSSESC